MTCLPTYPRGSGNTPEEKTAVAAMYAGLDYSFRQYAELARSKDARPRAERRREKRDAGVKKP